MIQNNWRWCNKCNGLFFAGNATPGACRAGGQHDKTGSGDYSLLNNTPPGPGQQDNWQWCNKCNGLFFAGNATLGVCPACGQHDKTGSGNYTLNNTPPGPGQQDNWRWCNKCNGLFFAGNATPGACPACGEHDKTGSGNYSLQVGVMNGTITGAVTDTDTGAPIKGAKVAVMSMSTNTDSAGKYTLSNVPSGLQQVTASATRHSPDTEPATVIANSTITLNFALVPIDPPCRGGAKPCGGPLPI